MDPIVKEIYHPRVSVVMNVYNGEKYLRETLDSILAQTFTEYEFIIVDDGSTDSTADILREYKDERIKVITNDQNRGVSYTLNRGISLARGEYIAHTDCDDISLPDRLIAQVQFLDENASIDIIGSWAEIIDNSNNSSGEIYKYPYSPMVLMWGTFFNPPVAHSAVMIWRRIFDIIGKYNGDGTTDDFELWASLNLSIRFSNIQRPLLKYRVHESGISNTRRAEQNVSACRISHKAISSYLGNEIPLEAVKLIKYPYRVQSLAIYKESICVLRQLYRKFRKDFSLEPSEIIYVNLDVANKFSQISNKNHQYISSRFLRIYAIIIVGVTLIYDLIKNNHIEVSKSISNLIISLKKTKTRNDTA